MLTSGIKIFVKELKKEKIQLKKLPFLLQNFYF